MQPRTPPPRASRRPVAHLTLAALAMALALQGCGGGAVFIGDNGGFAFTVNAFQDGLDIGRPVRAGEAVTVSIQAGQSIEFDANAAVTWRFTVNGGASLPAGASVSVPGLAITVTALDASRVRVATALAGGAASPANITLTGTSNLDRRDVATVQLQVR